MEVQRQDKNSDTVLCYTVHFILQYDIDLKCEEPLVVEVFSVLVTVALDMSESLYI